MNEEDLISALVWRISTSFFFVTFAHVEWFRSKKRRNSYKKIQVSSVTSKNFKEKRSRPCGTCLRSLWSEFSVGTVRKSYTCSSPFPVPPSCQLSAPMGSPLFYWHSRYLDPLTLCQQFLRGSSSYFLYYHISSSRRSSVLCRLDMKLFSWNGRRNGLSFVSLLDTALRPCIFQTLEVHFNSNIPSFQKAFPKVCSTE